ncbi:hypothetical protein ACFOON_14755 [Novosphingobium piscinae]|uniref:Uncharacterized protein n=1 Tax=Novosphingobium piscinae TaxID=1507448 RepID=A0A7X1KR99_9SPHN|nr:hypothetical protein [Novosphingobium piscinae]MBC2670395.1 hypothetical protein [Novosphingobium piscinae]
MSNSRGFASLSATLLARKGGARPAMRSPLQGPATPGDPLNDCGWNDMGWAQPEAETPAAATPAGEPAGPAVVVFEPSTAPEPLLARKPAPAEVLPFLRELPGVPVAPLHGHAGRPIVRRTRTAAFTLRLDPDRHYRLRLACAAQARSAQSLVTEAVDRLLDSLPDLEPLEAPQGAQRIAR